MAIVADAARADLLTGADYNTAYQKGNDNANTPNPTWVNALSYPVNTTPETRVTFAYDSGVNNTADAWVPHVVPANVLDKTVQTVRF